ncbi:unnamed protein product [Spirodela intermedia]|uniref:Uncharacterized protein n=1 Tax=Spirodela intermedia TaxID=51605 RepID=A0A7I8L8Q0_SPIIN|nr:unnamed protein product [Spirodela intermedia]
MRQKTSGILPRNLFSPRRTTGGCDSAKDSLGIVPESWFLLRFKMINSGLPDSSGEMPPVRRLSSRIRYLRFLILEPRGRMLPPSLLWPRFRCLILEPLATIH